MVYHSTKSGKFQQKNYEKNLPSVYKEKRRSPNITSELPLFSYFFYYTGYAPFSVSASFGSTFVCCASLYLKKSVATCGNRA